MAKQEEKLLGLEENLGLLVKLTIWLLISLALSLIFFREFWASLGTMLSPNWILGSITLLPGAY